MKYRNTKTGAIIETESILGGGWVSVDTQPSTKSNADDKKPVKKEVKRTK